MLNVYPVPDIDVPNYIKNADPINDYNIQARTGTPEHPADTLQVPDALVTTLNPILSRDGSPAISLLDLEK